MAFKLTKEMLEELVIGAVYHQLTDRATICILTLKNGFEVVGKSAVLNVENFDAASGQQVARDDAIEQLWALEGYRHLSSPEGLSQNQQYGLSFPDALRACFQGYRIARTGWNGRNMWVALTGSPRTARLVPATSFWSEHARKYASDNGGVVLVNPGLLLKAADGTISMGWIPSTSDLFANDWAVVPN